MSQEFVIASFKDVADGLQEGQFSVGERRKGTTLDDLDPIYRDLLDRPITVTMAVIGPDGRPGLTPMWFDHDGEKILVNTASHRPKCAWIRKHPQITVLVVNPDNPYHWVSIKCTVAKGDPRRRSRRRESERARQPHLEEVHRERRPLRVA